MRLAEGVRRTSAGVCRTQKMNFLVYHHQIQATNFHSRSRSTLLMAAGKTISRLIDFQRRPRQSLLLSEKTRCTSDASDRWVVRIVNEATGSVEPVG